MGGHNLLMLAFCKFGTPSKENDSHLMVSSAMGLKLGVFGFLLTTHPGGFTLHMIGYAPACTKSVEKGSFLDIRRRRRLLQKGYIFRC